MKTTKMLLLAGAVAIAPLPVLAAPTEAPLAEAVTDEEAYDPMSEEALAEAKAKMRAEIDQAIAMVEKLFGTDQLPPVPPAQLALARQTTGALVPDGSLERMMDNLYGTLLSGLLGEFGGTSDMMLSIQTGVEGDKIAALDAKSREAIADLFDPHRKEREEQIVTVFKPLIGEALAMMEPPMREGMAHAFARKFDAGQLGAMNEFFATPAGGAYAAEWMALQADPEVLLAMIKAVPALFENFIDRAPQIEGQINELPKERSLTDLSDAELAKLAKLLKVDVQQLKDNRDMWDKPDIDHESYDCDYGDPDSADAAACAVEAAAAEAAVEAVGYDDPAWDPENWTDADRRKVDELNAAASAATAAAFDAEAEAAANARKKLGLPDPSE
ncbi:MAG TPA: DUF2059 domain-containing protein [Sphingopyxis sp.]|nr:DUF2059 domain-containing protein [Sphingopyxis sp.]HMQ19019.1 DUF2059 domain-containing protein [Sphingopyxis sp.]